MIPISPKLRITLLAVLFLAIGVLFGLRLITMQIVEGAEYSELANKRSEQKQTVAAARGEIVDRYGRPMVVNRTGFNVVFDMAFLDHGKENDMILRLIDIMKQSGENWIDNLPLAKTPPFAFTENEGDVARLKKSVNVNSAATAQDVWYWLVERYQLENYTPEQQRLIAGVRYEMEQRGFNYKVQYTFAEDISISTITKIKENSFNLPGVDVRESAIREYVSADLAPHIIGRIGPIFADEMDKYKEKGYAANDIVGKEGIEQALESELRGTSGERQITLNNKGDVLEVVETKAPQPGNTVVLTIDKELQRVAQQSLEKQIKNLQQTAPPGKGKEADVGAAVVIHVPTGEVLASASYPSYNLATYQQDYTDNAKNPLLPFFNRALNGKYAPGSTYKPAVSIGALNEGVIERGSLVNCTGRFQMWNDYKPKCLSVHGNINVVTALQHSCNIFFYDTGWKQGIDKINKYSKMLGLGEPTGIELPENIGQRASKEYSESHGERWEAANVVMASIGQGGNEFSPLQIANYTATIANGGVRMKAHLVKSVVSYNFEQTVKESKPEVMADLQLKPGVVDVVRDGMIAAAGPNGTSLGAFNNYGVTVAAKTGTPETSSQTVNSVYIAFAPAEKPEIAVAVVIEDGWHGYTGVPVAKAIFDQYFFANKDSEKPQAIETLLS